MVGFDSEHYLEAEVRRIVRKLETVGKNKALEPGEHSRLLRDFEELLELKVLRQRGF